MKRKQILFTGIGKAELMELDLPELEDDEILTRMEYTVISGVTWETLLVCCSNP